MDKEILEILRNMQNDMKTMQSDMKTMQGDMKTMQGELKEVNQRLGRVENKTDKNGILLEDLNKKVETMAEVHSSLRDQLHREKDTEGRTIGERLDIIELAVRDTSSRVKYVQKDLSRVVRATADNWAEIVELKSIK